MTSRKGCRYRTQSTSRISYTPSSLSCSVLNACSSLAMSCNTTRDYAITPQSQRLCHNRHSSSASETHLGESLSGEPGGGVRPGSEAHGGDDGVDLALDAAHGPDQRHQHRRRCLHLRCSARASHAPRCNVPGFTQAREARLSTKKSRCEERCLCLMQVTSQKGQVTQRYMVEIEGWREF